MIGHVGHVERIISENPLYKIIIVADFNCNIFNRDNRFSRIIRDLMDSYGLMSTFELDSSFDVNKEFTRCCLKNRSYSLIDGILISKSLKKR